ncbi:mCG56928, partial [Mus musculus]
DWSSREAGLSPGPINGKSAPTGCVRPAAQPLGDYAGVEFWSNDAEETRGAVFDVRQSHAEVWRFYTGDRKHSSLPMSV